MWHDWAGQDSTSERFRALLDKFAEDNPEIELRVQSIIRDAYRSRLKTMAAADELPDVFLIWPDSMTREFANAGFIQPIDSLLRQKSEWAGSFMAHSFDSFTVDGKKYSVPMTMSPTSFVFYNQELFDKYEVGVPATWDELLAAIKVFNRNGITPIALGNKSSWVAQSTIFSTLADRVTGTDWFMHVLSQNNARFTDQEFLDALTKMRQLVKAGAFQDNFNYIDNMQMEQMYYRKQAAMFIEGGWAVGNLIDSAPKDVLEHTHLALLPTIPGGKGKPMSTSGVVGNGFAVNSKLEGDKLDAAFRLIYAMASPSAQRQILDSNTLVSYRMEVDRTIAHPLFVELHELMMGVTLLPSYETQLTTAAVETLSDGLQELMKGGSPEILAQKLQNTQASVLGKLR
ncbi:extracellular solute-binding protein [Paenibacillus doosanensis]|nr:extracellular solute-binding protein [Paenibacillus doosanensis]